MYYQGYQEDSYCRVTHNSVEYYALDDTKLDHLFDHPVITIPHQTILNAEILVRDKVICQTIFKNGFYISRFTHLCDLFTRPLVVQLTSSIGDFIVTKNRKIFYSTNSNQIHSINKRGATQLVFKGDNQSAITKFQIQRSRIYCLTQEQDQAPTKTLVIYDMVKKAEVSSKSMVIDFAITRDLKLIELEISNGEVLLNHQKIGFSYWLERDQIVMRLVQVQSQSGDQGEIALVSRKSELNSLYYLWRGKVGKVQLENRLPDPSLVQRHEVILHNGCLDYKVLIVNERQQKQVVNNIELFHQKTRYLITNMGYLFTNGVLQPHFDQHYHKLYNKKYLAKFPFRTQDMKPYTKSFSDNPYQVFRILIVNHPTEFIQAYKDKYENFKQFTLFSQKFAMEILENFQSYDFKQEFFNETVRLIGILQYFYNYLCMKYLNHLGNVYEKVSGNDQIIQKKFRPYQENIYRFREINLGLRLLGMGIQYSKVQGIFEKHREAKQNLMSLTLYPNFRVTLEHFRGFENALSVATPTPKEFIRLLLNTQKYALIYIAYCIFGDKIESELNLTHQDMEETRILYQLTFNRSTNASLAVERILNNGSGQKLYYPLTHLLLIHSENQLAFRVLYSISNDFKDFQTYIDVHIRNQSITLGYIRLHGSMENRITEKNRIPKEFRGLSKEERQTQKEREFRKTLVLAKRYISGWFRNGGVMEIILLANDMSESGRRLVKSIGSNYVENIGQYLDDQD